MSSAGASPGTSVRSALSESLSGSRRRHSIGAPEANSAHIALDIPTESRPRSRSARTQVLQSSSNEEPAPNALKLGTSPLLGSPWPFVVRQQQPNSPTEEASARPRSISWDSGPGHGALPSHRSMQSTLEEPLLEVSEEGDGRSETGHEANSGDHASDQGGSEKDHEQKQVPAAVKKGLSLINDLLYGIINAIVGAPTMISFAAIIFSNSFFGPYLAKLARLAFLSSSIHQAVFTLCSSLPFAVGQVQDVGLIFLSAMASSIADSGRAKGDPAENILGTALVTLAVSTFIVGLLIVLVGQFKLASLVQYVPLSTVGGYLGYVGYFCFAAGLGLACNAEFNTFASWANLFHHDQLVKLGPVLGSTLLLWATMHYIRSPMALPGVIILIPVVFHIVLLCVGWSIDDAAEAGWVTKGQKGANFWELYELFNIHDWKLSTVDKVAAINQAPKLLALFFVVAFGSSLDVAAIQAGMADSLDFNHELKTVGASNMISGLLGAGFTGSYIFSQTCFSMRANVKSKWHGAIIAGVEFALFAVPISVIQYMPNFFYGSLLALFGVEIIADWLIFSYHKVLLSEFILLWATYLAIMFTNLEAGIGIGIVLATLYFAFTYARVHVQTFSVVPSRSAVVRSLSERSVLEVFMARMAAMSLSGYIFFGSSVSIARQVTEVAEALLQRDEELRLEVQEGGGEGARARQAEQANPLWKGSLQQRTRQAFAAAPMFILLDFRAVHGLDATAAQSFGTLWTQLRQQGVELVLTHLKKRSMQRLLQAHGVAVDPEASRGYGPTEAARVFESMEAGVHYCEERYLEVAVRYQLCKPKAILMTLEDTLQSHDSVSNMMVGKPIDYAQIADRLRKFMQEAEYEPGQRLMTLGEEANELFIVEEGSVCVEENYLQLSWDESQVPFPEHLKTSMKRNFQYGPGAIIGMTDWFLERRRSTGAYAETKSRVWSINKSAFDRLSKEAPDAVLVLMTIIARTSILNEVHTGEYLERVNAFSG